MGDATTGCALSGTARGRASSSVKSLRSGATIHARSTTAASAASTQLRARSRRKLRCTPERAVISALQAAPRDLRASTTRTDDGALVAEAPRVSEAMRARASVALGHAGGALQRSDPGGSG